VLRDAIFAYPTMSEELGFLLQQVEETLELIGRGSLAAGQNERPVVFCGNLRVLRIRMARFRWPRSTNSQALEFGAAGEVMVQWRGRILKVVPQLAESRADSSPGGENSITSGIEDRAR
jgi:hypothetical protein